MSRRAATAVPPVAVAAAAGALQLAVTRRSTVALVPVAGFVGVLTAGQIAAEEEALGARFGEPYARYRAEVPRWVDARSVRGVAAAARAMKIR